MGVKATLMVLAAAVRFRWKWRALSPTRARLAETRLFSSTTRQASRYVLPHHTRYTTSLMTLSPALYYIYTPEYIYTVFALQHTGLERGFVAWLLCLLLLYAMLYLRKGRRPMRHVDVSQMFGWRHNAHTHTHDPICLSIPFFLPLSTLSPTNKGSDQSFGRLSTYQLETERRDQSCVCFGRICVSSRQCRRGPGDLQRSSVFDRVPRGRGRRGPQRYDLSALSMPFISCTTPAQV